MKRFLAPVVLALPLAAQSYAPEWRDAGAAMPSSFYMTDYPPHGTVLGHAYGITAEYDGTQWTELPTASRPGINGSFAMTYDAARDEVILFGGAGGPHPAASNETWAFDGSDWTQLFPATTPPARREFAMVYDSARMRVVMFGGYNGGTELSDTWEWDGADWTQMASGTPSARSNAGLAYDARRGVTVLFGGYRFSTFDDTWEWDGVTWTRRTPATTPPTREPAQQMAYDDLRGVVVMFGGSGPRPNFRDDTWEYDGDDWRQLTTGVTPPAMKNSCMVYESRRGVLVLRSAFNSTWELVPALGSVTVANGSGTNPLCFQSTSLPRLGELWTLEVDASVLPGARFTWMTAWSAPLAPGASLAAGELLVDVSSSLQVSGHVTSLGTTDHFAFAVPLDPALAGVHSHAQAVVLGGGSARLCNALSVVLGH